MGPPGCLLQQGKAGLEGMKDRVSRPETQDRKKEKAGLEGMKGRVIERQDWKKQKAGLEGMKGRMEGLPGRSGKNGRQVYKGAKGRIRKA